MGSLLLWNSHVWLHSFCLIISHLGFRTLSSFLFCKYHYDYPSRKFCSNSGVSEGPTGNRLAPQQIQEIHWEIMKIKCFKYMIALASGSRALISDLSNACIIINWSSYVVCSIFSQIKFSSNYCWSNHETCMCLYPITFFDKYRLLKYIRKEDKNTPVPNLYSVLPADGPAMEWPGYHQIYGIDLVWFYKYYKLQRKWLTVYILWVSSIMDLIYSSLSCWFWCFLLGLYETTFETSQIMPLHA